MRAAYHENDKIIDDSLTVEFHPIEIKLYTSFTARDDIWCRDENE